MKCYIKSYYCSINTNVNKPIIEIYTYVYNKTEQKKKNKKKHHLDVLLLRCSQKFKRLFQV